MHALGLHHEMQRNDRSKSVYINFGNMNSSSWSNFNKMSPNNFGIPYDYGSIMHYKPLGGLELDKTKFSIIALKQEYQSTMGLDVEPSFKDIKLLNRLYCTREYPHTSTLSKSINFGCDIKEYELNNGKCRNGGYPDPLKCCKCRCPEGYGGDYCTKYEYGHCRVTELKAKIEEQYITYNPKELGIWSSAILCLYVIKPKETNPDQIKAKRTLIEVRKIKGYNCGHPCRDNYIEIKYFKDKTPTGARICCDTKNDRILTISSEENTEVLIMMKGWIGEYDISYKAELAPSQESSNCIEVRKSIIKTGNLQSPRELYEQDGEGNWALTAEGKMIVSEDIFGPAFCLACKRDETININGEYSRNVCAENKDPSPKCHHTTCVYCKTVEGSNKANWYWENPKGEWIHVNLMDCYPDKGLN
uniref:Metalloendopeptidase n=2 Tax=Meloidogyne TaxID=189290 RepID=A0A6V7VYE0_MELEN|nr:unnamed protein product [Meloidogyne enterolobii]